jgi:hypothetical protein
MIPDCQGGQKKEPAPQLNPATTAGAGVFKQEAAQTSTGGIPAMLGALSQGPSQGAYTAAVDTGGFSATAGHPASMPGWTIAAASAIPSAANTAAMWTPPSAGVLMPGQGYANGGLVNTVRSNENGSSINSAQLASHQQQQHFQQQQQQPHQQHQHLFQQQTIMQQYNTGQFPAQHPHVHLQPHYPQHPPPFRHPHPPHPHHFQQQQQQQLQPPPPPPPLQYHPYQHQHQHQEHHTHFSMPIYQSTTKHTTQQIRQMPVNMHHVLVSSAMNVSGGMGCVSAPLVGATPGIMSSSGSSGGVSSDVPKPFRNNAPGVILGRNDEMLNFRSHDRGMMMLPKRDVSFARDVNGRFCSKDDGASPFSKRSKASCSSSSSSYSSSSLSSHNGATGR